MNTGKMQAIEIDAPDLKAELYACGLNDTEINRFKEKNIKRLFRLSHVPLANKSLLEAELTAARHCFVFIPAPVKNEGFFNAIIGGSLNNLAAAASRMELLKGEAAALGHMIGSCLTDSKQNNNGELHLGGHILPLGQRTLVMGILNVTPDSFSDGGRFDRFEKALAQAHRMAAEGADIIDIGGESTRPGHQRISTAEELGRIMPVIETLKRDPSFKKPLSIDTYKADVAEPALAAGVEMLNDIWGLKADPAIGQVTARYGAAVCLMHNRHSTDYEELIPDMISELKDSIAMARSHGIEESKIVVDPGIGFGKDWKQNLEVMKNLGAFCKLGYPLLLGTSRKSMIGKTLDLPIEERIEGTAATVAFGITAGAAIIRVHDVLEMRRVAQMTDAMTRR